jgi:4'-phosphopantetheinyl transferase
MFPPRPWPPTAAPHGIVRRARGKAINRLDVLTVRVDRLSEADVAPLRALLDDDERMRAARFRFESNRVQYIVAHALTRLALGRALSVDPVSFGFVAASNGKPEARLGGQPAPVSFNLSHTRGAVGVAVMAQADAPVGFDIEWIDRTVDLAIADRYFRPEEIAWIASLEASLRPLGFLRLWTLKEALMKATGEGLTRDLDSFRFDVFPPRLHFVDAGAVPTDGWQFEQHLVEGDCFAAAGLRSTDGTACRQCWRAVDPADLLSLSPGW